MGCSQLWQQPKNSGFPPPHPSVLSPGGFLQAWLWIITTPLVPGAAAGDPIWFGLFAICLTGREKTGVQETSSKGSSEASLSPPKEDAETRPLLSGIS